MENFSYVETISHNIAAMPLSSTFPLITPEMLTGSNGQVFIQHKYFVSHCFFPSFHGISGLGLIFPKLGCESIAGLFPKV